MSQCAGLKSEVCAEGRERAVQPEGLHYPALCLSGSVARSQADVTTLRKYFLSQRGASTVLTPPTPPLQAFKREIHETSQSEY